MKKIYFILLCLLLSCVTKMQAQETDTESPKIGISGTFQSSQLGISIPIWLGKKVVLAPSFQARYVQDVGIDYGIALAPRFYLRREKVSSYLGLRAGVLINDPAEPTLIVPGNEQETQIDMLAGVNFGGEYFFSNNLSFGVEIQGNFTKSDSQSQRFGNPDGLSFNTATMLLGTIYF